MSKDQKIKMDKKVNKTISKLESDFINALNDYERVIVLNKMEGVLEAECLRWSEKIEKHKEGDELSKSDLLDLATDQTMELTKLIDMINKEREPMLVSARAIYNARKNSHQEVVTIKQFEDGY